MSYRVLIVEDETMLRESMQRGLERDPELDVVSASSLEEGLERLEFEVPQLILSDLDLPGRSGLEWLEELAHRGLRHVSVTFITAFLSSYQAEIPRRAGVNVLEKPLSLDTLRKLVSDARRASMRRAGPADPFSAFDYLQLAFMGHHNLLLTLHDDQGVVGCMEIIQGKPWYAEDGEGTGEEAFHRLVFHEGSVSCTTIQAADRERNLERSGEALLLEAARRRDERERLRAETPLVLDTVFETNGQLNTLFEELEKGPREAGDPESAPAFEPAPTFAPAPASEPNVAQEAETTEATLARILDRGIEALLEKDYHRAWAIFREAEEVAPERQEVRANLSRLRDMGYGGESTS